MAETSSAVVLSLVVLVATAFAQDAPRHVYAHALTGAVVLTKATDSVAVVRVGTGSLEKVKPGDLIGTTKAVVKEITAGRLVLEETFIEKDGKPNRALIVIKEGERGGTRFLQRPPPDM